jgi:hypothetical protein
MGHTARGGPYHDFIISGRNTGIIQGSLCAHAKTRLRPAARHWHSRWVHRIELYQAFWVTEEMTLVSYGLR